MSDTTSGTDVAYVEMHGERRAYRQAGSGGEVVLLLHGMAGSSDTWQDIIPLLALRYRVIAPDLLGHGLSDKPRSDYSLGAFAASLRDLLDELDVPRVTLVGHSLGGGVAIQFLYQHPEYCRRLVLVSSGGLGPDVGWILRLLAAPGAELVLPFVAPKAVLAIGNRVRSLLPRTVLGSRQADQNWQAFSSLADAPTRSAFLHTLRSVVDYRGQSVSALSRLRLRAEIPTLVIWGDRDPIIPVEHGSAVQAARPNSTLTVLPGLGHFPHVEAPTEVAAAIDAFITGSRQDEHADAPLPTTGGEDTSDGAVEQHSIIEGFVEGLHAGQRIEVAVGLLMGLRGCSRADADAELRAAVEETGIPAEDLAGALVAAADTDAASSDQPADMSAPRMRVLHRWGPLLEVRGLGNSRNTTSLPADVRIRYAPRNNTVVC